MQPEENFLFCGLFDDPATGNLPGSIRMTCPQCLRDVRVSRSGQKRIKNGFKMLCVDCGLKMGQALPERSYEVGIPTKEEILGDVGVINDN